MGTVLITGCGSLIAEGIAHALARDGWHLTLTDLDPALARRVAAGVPSTAVDLVEKMDVTDPDEVGRIVTAAATSFGGIDALINVAGGYRGLGIPALDFIEHSRAQRERLVAVNLNGLFTVTHAVLPGMIAARRGSIVSVTAIRGLRGGAKAAVYSACKAAIIVFSQALAQEVGAHGIRVNTIAPGDTPARWKARTGDAGPPLLGRDTTPEDIGNATAFLLSERAGHITGSCLDVSGGVALH